MNESDKNTDLASRYETLRSYSFDRHQDVLMETISEHSDTCTDLSEMHNHWIDLFKAITGVYKPNNLLNQLVIHRYLEIFRNLRWVATSVFSGAYDSAMRDLRFILEDICQAVYIDRDHQELSIEEKYRKLEGGKRLRGSQLISKLRLSDAYLETIKGLYNELNDYVHPSHKFLMESLSDPRVVFFYNREWYEDVLSLHTRTADAVFCLVLIQFPKAGPVFIDRPHVESSLEEMHMKLTLKIGRQMIEE